MIQDYFWFFFAAFIVASFYVFHWARKARVDFPGGDGRYFIASIITFASDFLIYGVMLVVIMKDGTSPVKLAIYLAATVTAQIALVFFCNSIPTFKALRDDYDAARGIVRNSKNTQNI